jgi:predicted small metal-binding protein
MAKIIDCHEGHASVKIRGDTDDELVRNAQAHLKQLHPGMDLTREQILGMATVV